MFKNYLKTAWRNLIKNKSFSAINIFGLAIGMAACLLILQYVSFELSYDQFNRNAKNIYRVVNDRYQNGKLIQHGTITYSAISKAMQDDYPEEIASYARVLIVSNRIIIHEDKKSEENGLAVDNSFLNMFSFPLLAGDRLTALQEPNTLVLSEKVARKMFDYKGDDFQSLVGLLIRIENDSVPYKITGICSNTPENSHLEFDFLLSYSSLYSGGNAYWKAANHSFKSSYFWHYIQLKPGVNYKNLQLKFPAFSKNHFQGNKVSGSDEVFYLQPLLKAHLYSDFEYEIGKIGNATVVWGLLVISLFIVIIAWINYINLATAKSIERAKEVGVRKVAGANRLQLIRQFLAESFMLNFISLLLAVFFVYLLQPGFNRLLGYDLSLSFLFQKGLSGYSIISGLILLILSGILISGFYPAFVLSSFKPITVLKGRLSSSIKGIALRKALVVGQFAITVILIIGSLVIYRQIRFMHNQQLGLNIDQMLIIKPPKLAQLGDSVFNKRLNYFKEEIKQLSHVKEATASNRLPGSELARAFDVRRVDDSSNNKYTLSTWGINYDFINAYKIKMLAGRDFVPVDMDLNTLHTAILNESAVKLLGFSTAESAIGNKIIVYGMQLDVIGVTADFHQKSLRYPIESTIFLPAYSTNNSISIKVVPVNLAQTISAIRKKYEAFFPDNLFDYYFLDEKFNEQYKGEQLFGKVFAIFSGFAIFIACLGLLGLSLFNTSQRIKEIGVRKVLGATVSSIVLLLSKDFIRLVLIANVIAFPLAWYVMQNWLNDFAYRITISWWFFAAAVVLAVFIALFTIVFQAIKAAIANPVKSLRTE